MRFIDRVFISVFFLCIVVLQVGLLEKVERLSGSINYSIQVEHNYPEQDPLVHRMKVTGYVPGPGERDALNNPVKVGWTAAVSRDKPELFGRKILVFGVGMFYVTDWIADGYDGRVDISVPNEKRAYEITTDNATVIVLPLE